MTGILTIGGWFFCLSIVTSIAVNVDQVLIARLVDPDSVTAFAVAVRICSVLALVTTVANLPLWAVNSAALARGDREWVQRTARRMTILGVVVTALVGIAILLSAPNLSALIGDSSTPTTSLLVGLIAWNILLAATAPWFMVQNAVGVVWPQLLGWSGFLLVTVALKVILLGSGAPISMVPLVSFGGFTVLVAPLCIWGAHLALTRPPSHDLGDMREPTTRPFLASSQGVRSNA